jgi:hypothetical protein
LSADSATLRLYDDDIGFARRKGHIDRILADDRRELAGRRVDQIAHGEIGKSDAAVDRRTDLGVTEIDLRLLEQRLRLQHVGLRGLLVGGALIDRGLRDVLVLHQLLAALELQRRR